MNSNSSRRNFLKNAGVTLGGLVVACPLISQAAQRSGTNIDSVPPSEPSTLPQPATSTLPQPASSTLPQYNTTPDLPSTNPRRLRSIGIHTQGFYTSGYGYQSGFYGANYYGNGSYYGSGFYGRNYYNY